MTHSPTSPQLAARTLHPVVLHPNTNDGFIATDKAGKQIAVQVHFLCDGEVLFCIWRDGAGLVGSMERLIYDKWIETLADAHIDKSPYAWANFYDKQNARLDRTGTADRKD